MHKVWDTMTTVNNTFDILVVGDAGVGKSALVRKYVLGTFVDTKHDSEELHITMVGTTQARELHILDSSCTAEMYMTLHQHQVHNAQAMLFAFLLNSRDSYEVLEYTINCISSMCGDVLPPCMVVGLQLDRYDSYQVSHTDGQELAMRCGALDYFQVSLKTDAVDHVFAPLVERVPERRNRTPLSSSNNSASSLSSASSVSGRSTTTDTKDNTARSVRLASLASSRRARQSKITPAHEKSGCCIIM